MVDGVDPIDDERRHRHRDAYPLPQYEVLRQYSTRPERSSRVSTRRQSDDVLLCVAFPTDPFSLPYGTRGLEAFVYQWGRYPRLPNPTAQNGTPLSPSQLVETIASFTVAPPVQFGNGTGLVYRRQMGPSARNRLIPGRTDERHSLPAVSMSRR